MLELSRDVVSQFVQDWEPQPQAFRNKMVNKNTVAGPNGRPWTYLKALAGTHGSYLCDWLRHLDQGHPAPDFLVAHDLYFATKKPVDFLNGEPIYDAGSFRDISVGNVELRVLEWVAASPVAGKLQQIIHPDNVGWVPGRTILRPVTRTNRKVWERRGDDHEWGVLLLDFLKGFPSVRQLGMWAVMRIQGWSPGRVLTMTALHRDIGQFLRFEGGCYQAVPKNDGLWTGSGASTTMFLCLLDVLVRVVRAHPTFHLLDPEAGDMDAFADDFSVFARSSTQLAFFHTCLVDFGKWSGVLPSPTKKRY